MKNFSINSFFSKYPTIDLGDVKLRDLRLSDAERYYQLFADPKVSEHLSDEDIPKSIKEAEEDVKFWGSLFYCKRGIFWAIHQSGDEKLIGTIGFNSWNFFNRRGEISYDLMSDYWGRGIMTKVLTNVMMFAFSKMNIYRVEARTMVNNESSKRVLTKVGFKQEGLLRGYRFIHGEPKDIVLFSLVKNDFATTLTC